MKASPRIDRFLVFNAFHFANAFGVGRVVSLPRLQKSRTKLNILIKFEIHLVAKSAFDLKRQNKIYGRALSNIQKRKHFVDYGSSWCFKRAILTGALKSLER